jgi:hypothetical protein
VRDDEDEDEDVVEDEEGEEGGHEHEHDVNIIYLPIRQGDLFLSILVEMSAVVDVRVVFLLGSIHRQCWW